MGILAVTCTVLLTLSLEIYVFGTVVAEAKLSPWQLRSLSLSLVCSERNNIQFAFLGHKGWGRQWESPEKQRRAWTHPLSLHCLDACTQALYNTHLLLLHVLCQASYVCGLLSFLLVRTWIRSKAFSRVLYSLNSGTQYIWKQRKSSSGPIIFGELFIFLLPCSWLADPCLSAVRASFLGDRDQHSMGPCCSPSLGRSEAAGTMGLYTCEDLLTFCAVSLHTSQTVSVRPLRPKVQRDSYQLLSNG